LGERTVTEVDPREERERARLASLSDNPAEAYRIYEQLLRAEPDDPDTLLDYARAKYREFADLEAATRLFERLAERQPNFVEAQLWLGDLYSMGYGRGYGTAANRYREALRLDARAADAYVGLGMLHRVPSAPVTLAGAVDAFRRAVELEPARADARTNLAMALLESGQPAAARQELVVAEQLLDEIGESRQARAVRALLDGLNGGHAVKPGSYSNRSERYRWPRNS